MDHPREKDKVGVVIENVIKDIKENKEKYLLELLDIGIGTLGMGAVLNVSMFKSEEPPKE